VVAVDDDDPVVRIEPNVHHGSVGLVHLDLPDGAVLSVTLDAADGATAGRLESRSNGAIC